MTLVEKGFALAAELGVANVMALVMARATVLGYSGDPTCVRTPGRCEISAFDSGSEERRLSR